MQDKFLMEEHFFFVSWVRFSALSMVSIRLSMEPPLFLLASVCWLLSFLWLMEYDRPELSPPYKNNHHAAYIRIKHWKIEWEGRAEWKEGCLYSIVLSFRNIPLYCFSLPSYKMMSSARCRWNEDNGFFFFKFCNYLEKVFHPCHQLIRSRCPVFLWSLRCLHLMSK